ncbi:MAG: TetR/AcrR family transcriptional regulator [Aquihabitans sp.]
MSTSYEHGGRSQQKRRTREALVAAARDLVTAGRSVTIEDAASAASISRTTAYRYFSTQRALLLAAHPEVDQTTMLPPDAPEGARERLDAAVQAFTAMILDTEAQQRTMLRLSLDSDGEAELPLRQGRAVGWFREALVGRMPLTDAQVHSLAVAVRATTGIEALVWLVDIGGLSRPNARNLMCWSALALFDAAIIDPPPAAPG